MSDIHSPAVRSFNMSRIRNKDTKPELAVRKHLFSAGFRYRLHDKRLPGKPDIILPKYKTVIFINGCFWHGHQGCRYFTVPKTRTEWWQDKITKNKTNDESNTSKLREAGWKIISIWECGLKPSAVAQTLSELTCSLTLNAGILPEVPSQ